MSASLGSLVVSLVANTAQFTAGMDKAAYETDQAMKQMAKDAEMVGTALMGMAVVAAGALSVMVTNTVNQMSEMGKMAAVAGSSVEAFSRLTFAAKAHGIEAQGLSDIYKDTQEKIGDFLQTGGGEMADFFEKIAPHVGVTADQFARLSGPEALQLYYSSLEKANLSQSELTFYMESIASDSSKLIPLLADNGAGFQTMANEADRLGIVMSTSASKEATHFNETMGLLQMQQTAFAQTVTTAVLPVLQAIADKTLGAAQSTDVFATAGAGVRIVLETLTVLAAEVAFVFGRVGNTIGGTAAQLDRLAHLDFKGVGDINDMIRADDEAARKDHDAFLASILNPPKIDSIGGGRGTVNPPNANTGTPVGREPPKAPKAPKAGKDPDADFKGYMKNLEGQIEKMQELTVVEKLLADVRSGVLTVSPAQEAQLLAVANEITATKEAVRVSQERAAQRKKDDQDSLNAIREIEAEKAQEVARNAANVENIRISFLDELGQETLAHEKRLEELQKFHDLKLENVAEANALIEAENARHEQTKLELQTANQLDSLSMAGNAADQLYGLMEKAGKEQSALGKAVFLASKAIAVAEIILNTEVAAAKATAMFPVFGSALAVGIRVAGYASAGMVAGMAIAEASAEGGYDIPAGTNPMTQLHEREMVLPREHADVIRGLSANGGAGVAGDMTLTIVNNTSAPIGHVTEQRISPTERALIIQEAKRSYVADLANPNSDASRGTARHFNTTRSR